MYYYLASYLDLTVAMQCSSVASFSQRWFENDFSPVMKCAENASKASRTDIKFIYPTVDDVKKR